MNRRDSAFMIRLWRREDGGQRIEIRHIQAGTSVVVASQAAAVAWLVQHADDPPARPARQHDDADDLPPLPPPP